MMMRHVTTITSVMIISLIFISVGCSFYIIAHVSYLCNFLVSHASKKSSTEAFWMHQFKMTVFFVSSEEFQSARAECDGTSHVEKIFQQKNTFAVEKYSPLPPLKQI